MSKFLIRDDTIWNGKSAKQCEGISAQFSYWANLYKACPTVINFLQAVMQRKPHMNISINAAY